MKYFANLIFIVLDRLHKLFFCLRAPILFSPSKRSLRDFQHFLKYSMTNPLFEGPFGEADKRCLSVMENVANRLSGLGLNLLEPPLVSVIMPINNRASMARQAIESVLDQSYRYFELIIIIDGSTDETADDFGEIRDNRLRLINIRKQSGPSVARNAGLASASGQILAYLDCDHRWDERYLATIVGAFTELPVADGIYSGIYLYRNQSKKPFAVRYGHCNRSLLENRNYIDMNCFAHRRRLLDVIHGFDEDLNKYFDYDLVLRAGEAGHLFSLPVLLCNYIHDARDEPLKKNPALAHQIENVWRKMRLRRRQRELELAGKQLFRPVSLVIPSFNAAEDIRECLDILLSYDWNDRLDVVVVDNASRPDVVEFLQQLKASGAIKLILNDINMGFTFAVNQGIAVAPKNTDIMILNNDAVLTKAALITLQEACYRLPDAAITVPRQVLPAGTKTINVHVPFANTERDCDVNISAHHNNLADLPIYHSGREVELTFAPFFAAYIRGDVIAELVGLDAEHGRHYRSDQIFCELVRNVLRKKIYYVRDAMVVHKLQKSTDELRTSTRRHEFNLMFHLNKWDSFLASRLGFRDPPWDD